VIILKINVSHVSTPIKSEFDKLDLHENKLIDMLKTMVLIRAFEEKVEELYLKEGVLIGPAHLYFGSEAIAAGVKNFLQRGDLVISHHRGHGHAIMLGIEPSKLFAELLGFREGNLRGLGGSMHLPIDVSKGGLYASAIVGSQIPIAVGVAFSQKYRKTGHVTIVFLGDGATNTGAFAEGMVMASFLRVPLALICEDNKYAEFTRTADLFVDEDVVIQRFLSYNIPVLIVDGNDPLSVYKALKIYENELRSGKGPVAIVANTYRLKGHGVYDKAPYKPLGEVELYSRLKDPILTFANRLVNEGIITHDSLDAIFEEAKKSIEKAFEEAKKGSPLSIEELYFYV
jgi:pyruvate dehydrogenase E1 component alpha subunit